MWEYAEMFRQADLEIAGVRVDVGSDGGRSGAPGSFGDVWGNTRVRFEIR